MDKKIADIYKPMNDLKDQLDIMKKGKSIDDNWAVQTASSSATLTSAQEASRMLVLVRFCVGPGKMFRHNNS